MLSHTKLINALKFLSNVETSKYIIRELFDNAELVDSAWVDGWKNEYWEKPTRANAVTYQGCTTTRFKAVGKDIIILHTVWDGEISYGNPTKKRCTYNMKLSYSKTKCVLYKFISQLVENELALEAIGLYNKELQAAKDKRVNEILQNLLGEL